MRICGMDEVGRGALAGPLVGAAIILNSQLSIADLDDSKKLSKKQREKLHKVIFESGAVIEIEIISVRQINSRGIGWANKEIFKRLIRKVQADKYIIDGPTSLLGKPGATLGVNKDIRCIIKADETRKCVMAASIVAKVTRDKIMAGLAKQYPNYAWDVNAGYGTKLHINALREHGEVKHHRSVYVTTALSRNGAINKAFENK